MSKKKWDFIKIPVTKNLIPHIFMKGEKHYNIKVGLDKNYKLYSIIQEPTDGMYYFLFIKGEVPEGTKARLLICEIKRVNNIRLKD